MATRSPSIPASGEHSRADSELSQSLSDLSSVGSSLIKIKKKKGKRKKNHSADTPNFSKFELDNVGQNLRDSEIKNIHHKAKPVQQSLRGMQVCARSCRDGLFYPGVVLKHADSRQVLVQFADGQMDRVNTRFAVPRGGALPCPVLHSGDYVLVRVRSKYGQHPSLSTGQCDYFIPAIVQVTPYKGGMTFPPCSVPAYSAVSFNGRPVTSLRAGMVRISRDFFLTVCRYIQQLMVEMSTGVESGEETERHPALFGSRDREVYIEEVNPPPRSPSVETLSKLVERQNEQHQELMERLSQVISFSSPGSVIESAPVPHAGAPAASATSPPPNSPHGTQSPTTSEPPSPAPPERPCSAPSYTQTGARPIFIEQGTQKTGVQDNWTESLPCTFSQGTSTQLDELVLGPPSDPRLESIESCQKRLLEELEGVSKKVDSLQGEREEPPNAYLVMQPNGQALLVPKEEKEEDSQLESSGREQSTILQTTGPALKIQDLTPPVSSPVSDPFYAGERVLVDSREDGWFYTADVVEQHEGGYVVCVKVSGDHVLLPMVQILPLLSSERKLPEVYADQRVLAEHPSYPGCYAPGAVMHLVEETGSAMVRLYDEVVCEVQWNRIQPVEADVCVALSELATQRDSGWMTARVVSRRDHTGVFYAGQVVGKSWKTRNFMVQYSDGAIEEQSLAHIFKAPDGEGQGIEEGDCALASPDTGLFMPGEVVERAEERVVVRFCHGEEKEIELGELIAISRNCYQDMFLYISQQQNGGEA